MSIKSELKKTVTALGGTSEKNTIPGVTGGKQMSIKSELKKTVTALGGTSEKNTIPGVIGEIADSASGGRSFILEFYEDTDTNEWQANKTPNEIKEAIEAGMIPVAKLYYIYDGATTSGDGNILHLAECNDTFFRFSGCFYEDLQWTFEQITIQPDEQGNATIYYNSKTTSLE